MENKRETIPADLLLTSSIYWKSYAHKSINKFWQGIKVAFKHCFLARISQMQQAPLHVLKSSRVVQYLINLYRQWRNKISCYLDNSLAAEVARDTIKCLYLSPLTIGSIIIITAIDVNIFLCFLLQTPINLWGWLVRTLLFLVAASGLFCSADWPTLQKESRLFRKMQR